MTYGRAGVLGMVVILGGCASLNELTRDLNPLGGGSGPSPEAAAVSAPPVAPDQPAPPSAPPASAAPKVAPGTVTDPVQAMVKECDRGWPTEAVKLNQCGIAYGDAGQPKKALEAFTRAFEKDPLYVEANANRGVALMRLGRCKDALTVFEAYREADGHNAWRTWAFTARCLVRTGAPTARVQAALQNYANAAPPGTDMERVTRCVHDAQCVLIDHA